MKIRKGLPIGLAMMLVMAGAISRAEADTVSVKGTVSGSSITTEIDTNGDGVNASLGTGIFVSTLGGFTTQGVTEYGPPVSSTGACPSDNLEFPLVLDRGVLNYEKTGDQLFVQATSGRLCVDPNTGSFSFSGAGIFTGGTGQFAGATGSFTANGAGTILIFVPGSPHRPARPDRSFASFTATLKGTLIIPDNDND